MNDQMKVAGPYAPAFYRAQEILNQTQERKNEPTADPKLATDHFRMYSFKIDACPHVGQPHDMNECPYLHPGEKARRRDPRVYHYQALPCPDFRKSQCKRGDACPYGHGVFECWLHPSKYRTTLCKEGTACTRSVCFFAHTLEQLREPTSPAALSSSTTAKMMTHPCPSHLPPIETHPSSSTSTTRGGVSALKTFAACCENNHPNSPGSILHQQCGKNSNFTGEGFTFSTTTPSYSSADTSRCGSPGVPSIAAAMESLRQASLSVPSSVESSLATTPLGFSLPISSSLEEKSNFFIEDNGNEVAVDVAMAAAVALRAQQQQAASAAAAAQAVLARILETAAANGLAVVPPQTSSSCSSSCLPPPRYSSLSTLETRDNEDHSAGEEFALQQLIAGLGL